METLRQSSHYFPLEWVLRQGWRQTGTQADTTYHVAMRQSLPVSSQAPSPPSDWLSTDALSVFCLTKERKLLGEFFCKLGTTAKLIVILTMIQESLHHPATAHINVCGDGTLSHCQSEGNSISLSSPSQWEVEVWPNSIFVSSCFCW